MNTFLDFIPGKMADIGIYVGLTDTKSKITFKKIMVATF